MNVARDAHRRSVPLAKSDPDPNPDLGELRWVCLISWVARLRGLLGRPAPPAREVWCLPHCCAVHTLGMAYAIDVVWLAPDGQVLRLWEAMPPARLAWCFGANHVCELAAYEARRLGWLPGAMVQPCGRFVFL